MADKISVLIVDDISSTLDNLQKLLSFEDDIEVVATAANGRLAVEEGKRLHPHIVLMDVNMPEMDGIQATEVLASEAPNSPVIIMSVQGERDYLRRAMQSGAREFLIKPFSGDELIASIRRVHQLEERKETYTRGDAGPAVAVAAPVAPRLRRPRPRPSPRRRVGPTTRAASSRRAGRPTGAPRLRHRRRRRRLSNSPRWRRRRQSLRRRRRRPSPQRPRTINGEVIVLYGGKGGVGKSVLATNLAAALARSIGAKVGLIDLDLQFGDIGVLLNLPQTQSISDVVENIDQLDADFVRDVMSIGPEDTRVLTTPPNPELADLVTPEHVQAILTLMRSMFDFVVVDTSSHLGDVTLTALEMANRVVLVSALSIPAVKNAKLALRLFETLSIPTANVTLVLNRCEAHTEFNKDSIESHLKFPIAVQLPHDPRTVVNSINRGIPFVVTNPEAEASQRMRELVALLLPERQAEAAAPPRAAGAASGGDSVGLLERVQKKAAGEDTRPAGHLAAGPAAHGPDRGPPAGLKRPRGGGRQARPRWRPTGPTPRPRRSSAP